MKIAVRKGQLVVPTCPSCGCRLEKRTDVYYTHFGVNDSNEKDARGCRCSLLHSGFAIINQQVIKWPFLTSF